MITKFAGRSISAQIQGRSATHIKESSWTRLTQLLGRCTINFALAVSVDNTGRGLASNRARTGSIPVNNTVAGAPAFLDRQWRPCKFL